MKKSGLPIAVVLMTAGTLLCSTPFPELSPTGPDASAYGAAEHFPAGTPATAFEKEHMVATFSGFDSLYPTHTIAASSQPWAFRYPSSAPEITYMHAGNRYLLKEYLTHLPVTGLLIAKDDQILYEGYQYARTDRGRFLSQSMAKTIVGMLAGVAVSEHAIGSVSDLASEYVPELRASDYGKVTIRDLLHMSSGVTCSAAQSALGAITPQSLAHDCKQAFPAGTHFRYSEADSEVLGLIVRNAVKMSLASYLQEKIWKNIGSESKATWAIDQEGRELPYCCFNATLRDYARFGRLLAWGGNWNGKQLIPRQWLLDATTMKGSDTQLLPGESVPFFGYGYQLWILPEARRMFVLLGANGQRIFVDPQSKLIMVQTAVMKKAIDPSKDAETIGLWLSLVHHYKSE